MGIFNNLLDIKQSLNDLSESELKSLNMFRTFDAFILNLEVLMNQKLIEINSNSKQTSDIMSVEQLSLAGLRNYYNILDFMPEEIEKLISKLQAITDFSYPILELFPGNGIFTGAGVAGEPLYIVDYYSELLNKVGEQFNNFYNTRRLMKSVIWDFNLNNIPDDQIGLAYSFNYFLVKDEDFIFSWAEEVQKKLRDGGYFIFNFIPMRTAWGLELTENNQLTAIDHLNLINRLEAIGYEIMNVSFSQTYASTMLIKKAGNIKPFKLSSSSAKIIDKSEPFV